MVVAQYPNKGGDKREAVYDSPRGPLRKQPLNPVPGMTLNCLYDPYSYQFK